MSNQGKGCLICIVGSAIFWLFVIMLLASCKPLEIVHDTTLEVVSIDYRDQTVLMRGITLRPKGYYYASYPLNRFEFLETGMKFEVK